ncbi:DUF397 domain-containing protein [Streptomyces coelicoflavus]|uniref:DUF397 domain-containing protein n=2 Tax=Streptomyces coelicoflavus TaxID=285562 RepID=A0A7K3PIV1_9ACTN|nr:DUF397 domain-containing protein [Streptomyces coelicoflavus]NEB09209.1 DUF397 domain-containing protein [Streptomyces coelicoflavus]
MSTDLDGRGGRGPSLMWVRSSYSNGAGGECVECAAEGDRILVRDTKTGGALMTSVSAAAWQAFTHAVRARSAPGADL